MNVSLALDPELTHHLVNARKVNIQMKTKTVTTVTIPVKLVTTPILVLLVL
jgi:hypothetical protein